MKCTKEYRLKFTDESKKIINVMSLEEKTNLMYGKTTLDDLIASPKYNHIPYGNGGSEKHGIPEMLFCDGPRGVVCGDGKSTCFPVSMMRGAAFDVDLEEKIGEAIGKEIRAYGGNLFGGVCINLPYNPGWGRSQEVYGEDSFLLGSMGAALVRGVQGENVIACVKHFAFNSMENSRFEVSVECDRRTEREVYLSHFKDCIDAGAAAIMSSYNRYQGNWCSQHNYLLKKVLKEEWDFDGFVMSDFLYALKDTVDAANGGCDMEMCDDQYFGHGNLIKAVQDGLVHENVIDEAVLRIVRTMLAFERENDKVYSEEIIGCEEHKKLALLAAQEGLTLLKNSSVLPLNKEEAPKILVLGKLADKENTGDHGSSWVLSSQVVTPVMGIQKIAPKSEVIKYDGSDLEYAKELALNMDLVIFAVGFNYDDEGEFVSKEKDPSYTGAEGGDRKNGLDLSRDEIDLIKAIAPIAKKSIAVLYGGNTIMMTEWMELVEGIFMGYYSGQEGGIALAQALFGEINPSGKLPFVIPYDEKDLPQVNWKTSSQYYDYYHGYTKLDKEGVKPLYPFGFGLSYTTFVIGEEQVEVQENTLKVSCKIRNTGEMDGAEVVQVYVGYTHSKVDRPVKSLKGFKRIVVSKGCTEAVEIFIPFDKIKWYNPKKATWELEKMQYEVYIGNSSGSNNLKKQNIIIE